MEEKKGMILYYVQEEKKKIQIEVIGMSMSIETKQLKPSDLNTQVGKLAGLRNVAPLDLTQIEKPPVIFCMPEIVIFSGVPNKSLDEFMLSYTTPKNINWTLYQLIKELSSERTQMEGTVKRLSEAKKVRE